MRTTKEISLISGNDINRLALNVSKQLVACYQTEHKKKFLGYHIFFDWVETCTIALTTRSILWELKSYGQLQTHPEDLLRRAANNMRDYEYRSYPYYLVFLCRAFARQFGDFNDLPRRKFDWNTDCSMLIYDDGSAAHSDRSARRFKVVDVYSHDEFGREKDFLGYYVSERYPLEWENCTLGCLVYEWELAKVVPFDDKDEAKFFIAQLVDLLNTGYKSRWEGYCSVVDYSNNDYINQMAAQIVRDTLAQAPVEETLLREEAEAKARAERLEKERIAHEKAALEAQRQAKRREKEKSAELERKFKNQARGGDHVYILDLEFGIIKIGHSTNVTKRALTVQGGGMNVSQICCTEGMTVGQALQLEAQCHKHFADCKKQGQREYFYVTFDEACVYLQSLVKAPLIFSREEKI